MSLSALFGRSVFAAGAGLAVSLTACGGGGGKTVDAEDWVSDFCEAAIDYQGASDDLGKDFIDIEFEKKGAKDDIVKLLGNLQKEQDTFEKAASKAGTPDLDSGKDIRKAVDDEFKARSDALKDVIAKIKKLDEGRDFGDDVQEVLNDAPDGGFRETLDKLASRRSTSDAQDIIDLIEEDSECSSVAFSD
jgi:hypothetical protein